MQVAILSDVHSNLPALTAVLRHLGKVKGSAACSCGRDAAADAVWCLGDTVGYNAQPAECLQLVREHSALTLLGNHDWATLTGDVRVFNPHAAAGVAHARRSLSADDLKWLTRLQPIERLGDPTTARQAGPLESSPATAPSSSRSASRSPSSAGASDPRGSDARGSDAPGSDARGPDPRASDARGPRGSDTRGANMQSYRAGPARALDIAAPPVAPITGGTAGPGAAAALRAAAGLPAEGTRTAARAGRRPPGALLCHGSPDDPLWEYLDVVAGRRYVGRTDLPPLLAFGHTHVPFVLKDDDGGIVANVGSVGQPRDGDPRAAFLLVDLDTNEAALHRVAYDIDAAAAAVKAAGLPRALAERLYLGR